VPRVTATTVKEIIQTTLSDDVINTNHIKTANTFVDEYLNTVGLSDNMLEQIELYLSAHYVALTEEGGPLTRDKLGDADTSFANIYATGLKSTRYGQAALALDVSGTLSSLTTTQLKANFRVV
jgi:hypothetical protein